METTLEKYSVSNAKENLSALLSEVETNKVPFIISRYGKPIALVSSYESTEKIQPNLKGALNNFANPNLIGQEKQAWRRAVTENEDLT